MPELAYSVIETAKLLGRSKNTIYGMVKQNQIPYIRTSKSSVIIPKAALEKWLLEKPFENMEQPIKAVRATKPSTPRILSINGIKHPAVRPGCGGRSKNKQEAR